MKNKYVLLSVSFLLFLTGCTPKEKTVLLPEHPTQEATEEETESFGDYTVKKIYTYEYETDAMLEKSAYLTDCKEREIRVVATEASEAHTLPTGRQVDYRYGFYDTLYTPSDPGEQSLTDIQRAFWGLFIQPEDWAERPADTMEDAMYHLDRLLLSSDGTRLLVYAGAESWDNRRVWLYDLRTGRPWFLYEGSQEAYDLPVGSFSRDGRYVTFDIRGSVTLDGTIPVYDCQKEPPTDDTIEENRVWLTSSSSMYLPDQTLRAAEENTGIFRMAELVNVQGKPGVITFLQEDSSDVEVVKYQLNRDAYSESVYWLYGLSKEATLTIPYEVDTEENRLYYLINFYQLWDLQLEEGTSKGPEEFSDALVSFLRLDNGDLLALCTEDPSLYFLESSSADRSFQSNTQMPSYLPPSDLYLYPAGRTERKLLYKNLQNVIAMEYDARTRRILIETTETESRTHRTCIILEL